MLSATLVGVLAQGNWTFTIYLPVLSCALALLALLKRRLSSGPGEKEILQNGYKKVFYTPLKLCSLRCSLVVVQRYIDLENADIRLSSVHLAK